MLIVQPVRKRTCKICFFFHFSDTMDGTIKYYLYFQTRSKQISYYCDVYYWKIKEATNIQIFKSMLDDEGIKTLKLKEGGVWERMRWINLHTVSKKRFLSLLYLEFLITVYALSRNDVWNTDLNPWNTNNKQFGNDTEGNGRRGRVQWLTSHWEIGDRVNGLIRLERLLILYKKQYVYNGIMLNMFWA